MAKARQEGKSLVEMHNLKQEAFGSIYVDPEKRETGLLELLGLLGLLGLPGLPGLVWFQIRGRVLVYLVKGHLFSQKDTYAECPLRQTHVNPCWV